jgi:hypothetical protein
MPLQLECHNSNHRRDEPRGTKAPKISGKPHPTSIYPAKPIAQTTGETRRLGAVMSGRWRLSRESHLAAIH